MASIEKALSEITKQLETLNDKMNKAEKRDKDISERMSRIESSLKEFNDFKTRIDTIESQNRQQKTRIVKLEAEIKRIKVEKIRTSIEIYGIPETENENLKTIITEVAEQAKMELEEGDLVECYRPRREAKRERPIRAKLRNIKLKNDLVQAAKKRQLTLREINRSPKERRIYVNDLCLLETKRLLYLVKQEMRNRNWYRAWIFANDVYLIRGKGEQNIKIENEEDLATLIRERNQSESEEEED